MLSIYVGRFHSFIGHKGPQGEQRYSSTLFLTSALEGSEGSALLPGRNLPPGKTRYPFYRRLDGPQDRSGQVRKISPPLGFDPRTIQSVSSRYTDYANRPPIDLCNIVKIRNLPSHKFWIVVNGVEQLRTKYKEIPRCIVELHTCPCSKHKTLYSHITYLFTGTRKIFAVIFRYWKNLKLQI